ncbi:MAG TPA: FMN-binding glutamate synthase family protein, partial [Planctomycetes bacterium]|nr:FMN-binding glutamate synthase family protein [Planctomycetota bacterium]
HVFYRIALPVVLVAAVVSWFWTPFAWSFLILGPLFLLGVVDSLQRRQAVRRNFPVIGNLRYLFEAIRPEISQYFIESNTDGKPFSRELRSIVYQRAKQQLQTVPFGTQHDLYQVGAEWVTHSLRARHPENSEHRVRIGGPDVTQPYDAALLNVSAMSFGSLSKNAIRALSAGAKAGGFYHNTGEGGLSPHHIAGGGDLVWQIGTGYFGCRNHDGSFNLERFSERARQEQVKMIEIKLSQGAKPGHGGILPAAKITPEIAEIRDVPMGQDVISPPSHSAFEGPEGLLEFCQTLREHSGGKPVGFKLCLGRRGEFLAVARAMRETGMCPDFITVDGAEGGTGAAPLEFSNSVGWPLTEALLFIHNTLVGFGVRGRLKIIASGKIITGFHMAQRLALGADLFNSARGMMFALGCIQARRCHSNECPVGVATQDPHLVRGLDVEDKIRRVRHFQQGTVHSFLELLGAAGLSRPQEIGPQHILRRISDSEIRSYAEIYRFLEPGELLEGDPPAPWDRLLSKSELRTKVG